MNIYQTSKSNMLINFEKKKQINFKQNEKRRLIEIDFARGCCCIGIIIFHFFCHAVKPKIKFLFITSNADFGFLYVTVFFSISGIVLFNKYSKIKSLKYFYFRRWKSIFPPFYLSYFYFSIKTIFYLRKTQFIFKCKPSNFIFTFLGLDGFFGYKYCSFYLIGEWFLGAIIIIYFLYPLLIWAMNKKIYPLLIICGYIFILSKKFFVLRNDRNLIVCLTSFYFGIISLKYKKYFFENNIIGIASILLFGLLCFVKLSKHLIIHQIQGFSFLITLINIGKYIMNSKIKSIIFIISKHSFHVYLFHHQIIYDVTAVIKNGNLYAILISITLIILLSLMYSQILFLILNSIFKNNIFTKIELIFSPR